MIAEFLYSNCISIPPILIGIAFGLIAVRNKAQSHINVCAFGTLAALVFQYFVLLGFTFCLHGDEGFDYSLGQLIGGFCYALLPLLILVCPKVVVGYVGTLIIFQVSRKPTRA